MTIKIKIPESARKYMNLQCNSVITDYTECKELTEIYYFLKNMKKPIKVLELGAGLGRVSVYLRNEFNWNNTFFHLLDGDSGDVQIAGMNYAVGNNYYNSMEATSEFCKANNIDDYHLVLMDAANNSYLGKDKYDLCFSCKAIGFHWPINDYINRVYPAVVNGGYLFFEIRSTRSQDYQNERRRIRAREYVEYQLRSIDRLPNIEILFFSTEVEHPILLLKKRAL